MLIAGLLAFLSLIKGTHLVLSVATLGVVLAGLRLAPRMAAHRADCRRYAGTFLLFWLLPGRIPATSPRSSAASGR